MTPHLNVNDSRYPEAAARILQRYEGGEAEANITSAVRDFLILTNLVRSEDIIEENPPSDTSRRAVDLVALDTFIEVKRRIGTSPQGEPDPVNIRQLDDYLKQSLSQGKVRMGVLTDGKRWFLRWLGAGQVRMVRPFAFTLDSEKDWLGLYEWLRDTALFAQEDVSPDQSQIKAHFGPLSPSSQRDLATLHRLYADASYNESVRVKRQLWHDLLRTALGEIASNPDDMDDLFIRHTYLSAVIGIAVQASFGLPVRQLAESNPADLIHGGELRRSTGIQGILEPDFFAWPVEVGGLPFLQTLARRVVRFNWLESPTDIAATLYQTVIPADERRQLGEYYTPDWLARTMIREVVDNPLEQRVLDPACGSGTFVAEAVSHFISAAKTTDWSAGETLERLRQAVTGIDVHPVAVHLARSWTLAARPAIEAAAEAGAVSSLSIPVYLGDALQLYFRTGDLFAEKEITLQVRDYENTQLTFPVSLVDRAEDFDALMGDIAEQIESGEDPYLALSDNGIDDPGENQTMRATIASMQSLHDRGRNHIWAYYTRNMVRPVALSRAKVDVVIGNPPWLTYNKTSSILRDELERQSKEIYNIWRGGQRGLTTHQDVAGLFFARSVDLYLRDGGVIGFVMPHSALIASQYEKWRTGQWYSPPKGRGRNRSSDYTLSVDFSYKTPWDLESLEPNDFFPIASSVVFARSLGRTGSPTPLPRDVERWTGSPGPYAKRGKAVNPDTSSGHISPYAGYSREGAVIVPRCLFFANETQNTAVIQAGQTITVNPRRGGQDKAPWKDLDLTAIMGQTIERSHLFNVHLGQTVVPYATLEPLQALLPLKRDDTEIPTGGNGPGGLRMDRLDRRMRERWRVISRIWDENKAPTNKLDLAGLINYMRQMSSQLEWRKSPGDRPVRIVYNQSGRPTAALVSQDSLVIDYTLYWVASRDMHEAHYLLGIINSDVLYEAVEPLMPKGQFGARHVQKHLWRLPIPEFDPSQNLHVRISEAGAVVKDAVGLQMEQLRQERGDKLTVAIARRELRKWLRSSDEGRSVENLVGELLAEASV